MIQKFVNSVDEFPGGTSGTITIPATTPGNVLVILAVSSHGTGVKWVGPNHISTTDGDFTEVPFYSLQAGLLWDWGSFPGSGTSSDILYQVTSGGVTTVNWNTNTRPDMICVREISGLQTPVVVDDFKMSGSASGVVVGSALAGGGGNDLCYENFATFNYNIAGSLGSSPWMNDLGLADNGGSGAVFQIGVPGTQSAPAPVDFNGNPAVDQYTCTAVAFRGIGAAPTTPVDESGNPVTLKYAFSDNYNLRAGRFVDTNDNIHTIGPLYSNDWSGNFNFFNPDIKGSGLGCPWGFTILGQRDLYVADQCDGRGIVWKIDIVTGICTRVCGGRSPGAGAPIGPALSFNFGFALYTVKAGLDGNIYIGCPNYDTIVCLNVKNVPITVCGITIPVGYAAEVAGFDTGQGFRSDYSVCADAAGNVYAGEEGDNNGNGNKIWKTDPTGAATLIAGNGTADQTGDGGPASAATLNAPLGLAIDNNNILYVVCNGGNSAIIPPRQGSVRAINLSGVPQTVCGKTIAPGNIDTLYNPGPLALTNFWACAPDYQGNVLVCELHGPGGCPPAVPGGGSRGWMHIIDSAGVYSQNVGTPVTGDCGWSGDGGPAIAAVMGTAFGVAVPIPVPVLNGTITIQKTVISGTPADHTFPFTMRPNWKAPLTLIDGASDVSTVPAGTYSLAEDPVALINEAIAVSNGNPASAIVVAPGDDIVIAVTNTRSVPGPPGGTSFVPKPPIGHGPFQVVPTDNSPNQAWQVSVSVNNKSIPLGVVLRYNEIAKYWVATISDSQGNILLDSIPLITGDNFTQNILRQFAYLGIGSAAIFNASAKSA